MILLLYQLGVDFTKKTKMDKNGPRKRKRLKRGRFLFAQILSIFLKFYRPNLKDKFQSDEGFNCMVIFWEVIFWA